MKTNRKLLGAAIVGLLVILVGILLWRRRRRERPDNQPPIDI